MGRLIAADKLLEETRRDRDYAEKNGFTDMYYERQALIKRINAQPTAYDLDKVIEQLGDYGNEEMDYYRNTPYEGCIEECIRKAIEIVRNGGKEKDITTRAKDDIEKDLC